MTSIYDFSRTVRELWAIHNAYRLLGFPADDISLVPDAILNGRTGYAGLQVKQGAKTFVTSIPRPMTAEAVVEEWSRLCAQIHEFKDQELDAVYATSFIRNDGGLGLIWGLQSKGFKTTW